MKLAAAKPQDAGALAVILSDWIDETPWMPNIHTPEEDRRCLTHLISTCDLIAVRGGGDLLGFMARDGAMIHALYLVPSARGTGLGKRLLDTAKSRSDQLQLWSFQANVGARAFYAREGFQEVEMTDGANNDEKVPDVRLVWARKGTT
ncbi:MAG: GNAT family N-acetyltransferase [Rhodobacteraceae bacterium]|nr:GNAT family N-acetyltransferase [Paracoccaceae bacterium]